MSVNKARVLQLVNELRSGKYKQVHNRLGEQEVGFCCLGVACITAQIEPDWILFTKEDEDGNAIGEGFEAEFLEQTEVLPEQVKDYYGFGENNPNLLDVDTRTWQPASNWNDAENYTFEEIAELFENTFLK